MHTNFIKLSYTQNGTRSMVVVRALKGHKIGFFAARDEKKPIFTADVERIASLAELMPRKIGGTSKATVSAGKSSISVEISTRKQAGGLAVFGDWAGNNVSATPEPGVSTQMEPISAGLILAGMLITAWVLDRELARGGTTDIEVKIAPSGIGLTISSDGDGPPELPDNGRGDDGGDGEGGEGDNSPGPNDGDNSPPAD